MPTTVNTAFADFRRDTVDLDAGETATARASRDWLVDQIAGFPEADKTFPLPYEEMHTFYGSFHRRTKIRPLDDVDLISCLHAHGCTYLGDQTDVRITVPETATRLSQYLHDYTRELNSRKIINCFVRSLSAVPQYKRADIGRDGEAAVVSLNSYPWSFDVVPAFRTSAEADGRSYYLIPDGQGHWKKTEPKIDQDRVTRINQARNGYVLPALRLMKYWNKRQTKPIAASYFFESMMLSYFESTVTTSQYVDLEIGPALRFLAKAVLNDVQDPKGIQGNINHFGILDRYAVSIRADRDADVAERARAAETADDHKTSMRLWRDIFGPEFPTYG